MSGRIRAVQLAIQGMRKPSQRMPVGVLGRAQGPDECLPRQASLNVRVVGNIVLIVIVKDEAMPDGRTVNCQSYKSQQETQGKLASPGQRQQRPPGRSRAGLAFLGKLPPLPSPLIP